MKKLSKNELKKLQNIELEILIEFDKICKKNNLKYILVGGTLLGAIRHKGFIPWDDDIDVSMPRDDYSRLISILEKDLDKSKFYFQSIETEPQYGLPFGKLRRKNSIYSEKTSSLPEDKQGIWIDVFPIDYIDDNKILQLFTFIKIFYYKTIYSFKCNYSYNSKGIKKLIFSIISIISILYSKDNAKKRYFNAIKKCNKKTTNTMINHGGVYLLREITDKKFYFDTIKHKFEGHDFYIPKDYDQYLTKIYGDYMKLPPEEKRKSHHLVYKIKFPNK